MTGKSGIHNPDVIDALGYDPKSDVFVLAMFETRAWDGSIQRVTELQNKIDAYLQYIDSGQLWEAQPDAVGKRVRLELRCLYPPDEGIRRFTSDAAEFLRPRGIDFLVKLSGAAP